VKKYHSYKKRFIALIIISIVLLIYVYTYQISDTINKYSEYKDTKHFIDQSDFFIRNHSQTINRLEEIRKIAGVSMYKSSNQVQESILHDINTICKNKDLVIISFSQPHHYQSSVFNIYTCFFKLEGKFVDLTLFLNELELKLDYASVVSVKFYTEEFNLNKEKKLFLNIYIQSIKKI
jgi:hypothetical protein